MKASNDSDSHQHQHVHHNINNHKRMLKGFCTTGLIFQLVLLVVLLVNTTQAAPLSEDELETSQQAQITEYYGGSADSSCYYNFQHYEEGDRIITNEPCLNCTCHRRMLMCYLRVCPFTKAVGQNCTVEKKPDQCCPVFTCPEVPVQLLTSSTTPAVPSTESSKTSELGHLDSFGCMIENAFYPDGAQVPADPKNPCELCYCIRNRTACVLQECTLNVEGCKPVHQPGVCCPVRYDCDYEEVPTSSESMIGTGLLLTTTQSPQQCNYHGELYNDGELISLMQSEGKSCERCYCMRGEIVCAVQDCGNPLEGKDCQPIPPPVGQCCPTTYLCANETIPVDSLLWPSSTSQPADDSIDTESPAPESTSISSEQSTPDSNDVQEANEIADNVPVITEEQEAADSKQSGTQVEPETEITKVTSVAETHTEISISTKQDEATEKPETPIEESETGKPEGDLTNKIDISTPVSSSDSENVDDAIDSTEKEADITTLKSPVEDLPSSASEVPFVKPHQAEIDEPEITPEEEHTTAATHETVSEPVKTESSEQEHHDDFHGESEGTEKPQLEQTTIAEKISQSSEPHASSEMSLLSTISPLSNEESYDTESPLSPAMETVDDKVELEPQPTTVEAVTNPPEKNSEVTTVPIEEEITEGSVSSKDKHSETPEEEKVVPTTSETMIEPTQVEHDHEKPVEADQSVNEKVQETVPPVGFPSLPQIPELDIPEENDDQDDLEMPDEHVPQHIPSEELPTAETQRPVGSDEQNPVEEAKTTVLPDSLDSNKELDKTTVPTDLKVEDIVQEITTSESSISSQSNEDQTVLYSELHTLSQTSVHKEQPLLTTEPPVGNEISSDSERPTLPPHRDDDVQSAIEEEQTTAEKGIIPGEGSCLVDGKTYSDGDVIPATNPCHTECQCHSSIVRCITVECPPPPPHMKNCMPVQHSDDICCPIYTCADDEKDHITLQPQNQMGIAETNIKHDDGIPVSEDVTTVSSSVDSVQQISTTLTQVPVEKEKPEPELEAPIHGELESLTPSTVPPELQPAIVSGDVVDRIKAEDENDVQPDTVMDNLPDQVEHDVASEISEENVPTNAPEETVAHVEHSEEPEKHAEEILSETGTLSPESPELVTVKLDIADTEQHVSEDNSVTHYEDHLVSGDEITTTVPREEAAQEAISVSNADSTETVLTSEKIEQQEAEQNTQLPTGTTHMEHDVQAEHDEVPHESDFITEVLEESVPHETTPLTIDTSSTTIVPAKFEEINISEPTTGAPSEVSASEISNVDTTSHGGSSDDTPVVSEDQSSVASEVVDEIPTESPPVNENEEQKLVPTTVSTSSEVQDNSEEQQHIETTLAPQHYETTPGQVKDEFDNTNNILGAVLPSASTGVEQDAVHEDDHVPSEAEPSLPLEEVPQKPVDEASLAEHTTAVHHVEVISDSNIGEHEDVTLNSNLPAETTETPDDTEKQNLETETEKISAPVTEKIELPTEQPAAQDIAEITSEPQQVHADGTSDQSPIVVPEVTVSIVEEQTTESVTQEKEHQDSKDELHPSGSSDEVEPPAEEHLAPAEEEIPNVNEHPAEEEHPAGGEQLVLEVTTVTPTPQSPAFAGSTTLDDVKEKPEEQEQIPAEPEVAIPADNAEETEDTKKPEVESEVQKPAEHADSVESEDVSQQPIEEEKKPEESEVPISSTTLQNSIELTTRHSPHISESSQSSESNELPSDMYSHLSTQGWTQKPVSTEEPHTSEEEQQHFQPTGTGTLGEYEEEDEESSFGPGTCRYGGKVFVSAQQVPRDNPCDFCFCFRSDIICLQQSCPPPIHGCRQESIQGFCCPRYECPVSMATSLNLTTTTTTTTTTLPPHFFAHAYRGAARKTGCQVQERAYRVGDEIVSASGPCLQCICGADGQMKCDPKVCSPEPMLRKMIEAAIHRRR